MKLKLLKKISHWASAWCIEAPTNYLILQLFVSGSNFMVLQLFVSGSNFMILQLFISGSNFTAAGTILFL